ncbi:hypothetical protein HK100_004920 [Physocladia obscura]|uniref:Uncharacterized protein n=1 Tax=Physocladia obscura TaxID=109957 RepID=A0AAD5X9N2_9FUNG|nr:hypothetical protein HK100_004920 [Physocladia obscura]
MATTELVSLSALSASSTDTNNDDCYDNSCSINNVKQTAPNDENNHLTMWQSGWIISDWSSVGPYAITSFAVLFGPYSDGSIVSISSYSLCTSAIISDSGASVKWEICALASSAPAGTYSDTVSATFLITPNPSASANATCKINIYEACFNIFLNIQIHGYPIPSSNTGVSVGAVVGIVLGFIFVLIVTTLCCLRRKNLRKRVARWLNNYDESSRVRAGGWESLDRWAETRTENN